MSILHALILGILQGITEFLPISSSGHLLLFENIFGLNNGNMFFNILLHFASLIAIFVVFWKDVVELIKNPLSDQVKNIIIATIPTIVIGFMVKEFFSEYYLNLFLGFGFLISAIIIFVTLIKCKRNNYLKNINKKESFFIGLVQGIAVLPGISRSGSTICAGIIQGIDRTQSAKFSFLISIPVILGAMILEMGDVIKIGYVQVDFIACIVGFLASFIVALFTIKFMMKIVKKGNWIYFSIYLFLLSIFVLLNQYVLCLF